ncbi:MAG: hypothetical protein HN509_07165 [Halobacteriovoraceae bacterium]|nr:hypothetical protein [Halobacteriovoraceae bacterium]
MKLKISLGLGLTLLMLAGCGSDRPASSGEVVDTSTAPITPAIIFFCDDKQGLTDFDALGDGSAGDPFQICTVAQLQDIQASACGAVATSCAKNFILKGDLDLAGVNDWAPIASPSASSAGFDGTFDGDNHKISNLTMNVTDGTRQFGIFRKTTGNAVIKNLELKNFDFTLDNDVQEVGALVGEASSSTIENILVDINIEMLGNFHFKIGGVVGQSIRSTISSVESNTTVVATVPTGLNSIGGLVGDLSTLSNISNSTSTVDMNITKGFAVGGAFGNTSSATIQNINVSGVIVADEEVGGMVGQLGNNSILSNSVSSAQTSGREEVGGLIGRIFSSTTTTSTASGDVAVSSNFGGGLVGMIFTQGGSNAWVTRSSASGNVTGGGTKGGLIANATHSGAANTIAGEVFVEDNFSTGNVGDAATSGVVGGLMANFSDPFDGRTVYHVNRNYSTGSVQSTSNCHGGFTAVYTSSNPEHDFNNNFHDMDTSGLSFAYRSSSCSFTANVADTATSLSTMDMQTAQTFLNAGWDPAVWELQDGQYPTLK